VIVDMGMARNRRNMRAEAAGFPFLTAIRLRSNTLSVKNIAEECGYTNTSFFIAKFKQYFNRTPLEYRKELGIFDDSSLKTQDAWYRKTNPKSV